MSIVITIETASGDVTITLPTDDRHPDARIETDWLAPDEDDQ